MKDAGGLLCMRCGAGAAGLRLCDREWRRSEYIVQNHTKRTRKGTASENDECNTLGMNTYVILIPHISPYLSLASSNSLQYHFSLLSPFSPFLQNIATIWESPPPSSLDEKRPRTRPTSRPGARPPFAYVRDLSILRNTNTTFRLQPSRPSWASTTRYRSKLFSLSS